MCRNGDAGLWARRYQPDSRLMSPCFCMAGRYGCLVFGWIPAKRRTACGHAGIAVKRRAGLRCPSTSAKSRIWRSIVSSMKWRSASGWGGSAGTKTWDRIAPSIRVYRRDTKLTAEQRVQPPVIDMKRRILCGDSLNSWRSGLRLMAWIMAASSSASLQPPRSIGRNSNFSSCPRHM